MVQYDAVDPLEQAAILQSIGQDMVSVAPAEWTQLRFIARETVQTAERILEIVDADGAVDISQSIAMPSQSDRIQKLRTGMYEPDKGTWYTMVLVVENSGEYHARYEYNDEPEFRFPTSPHAFAADLEYFPRDTAHTPGWLAQRAVDLDNGTTERG
ncbi:hypothetical protein [Nocardia sp. NPDC058480]|uniref:hypothetical protein n=1 Tax=unclassified Nocardia TaxID=2637762 RepID=UPI003651B1BB